MSDPSFAGELFHFLRGKGCVVAFVSENTLSVQLPEARRTDAAALELELYLRVWETLHPDAPAEVVP